MKITVYRYRSNNEIKDVSQLNDERYELALEKVDSFNSVENNKFICEIYDTEKDNIPRDISEYVFKIAIDKRQIKLQDIIRRLNDLENSIEDLANEVSNLKYDIERVLE